jgi:ectoine hydroxylase-related dioxygenase (phytanoyl-CoA dioxygenase family)
MSPNRKILSIPRLSNQQVDDFHRDGFVIAQNSFTESEVTLLQNWATELSEMPEESGKQWVYHEKSKIDPGINLINRIEYISPFHSGFASLSKVLKISTSQLFDEKAVLFKEKINFKMPGGDGFKPHQDSQAGWENYADYFISVMVCIDEATVENGCLQLVKGYQNHGLYREWEPLTDEDMADMEFKDYPTKPGDLVFFDCYTPHASQANLSDKIRRLYFTTYNRLSEGDHLERYYADKHKTYPPDIDRISGKKYVFRV